MSIRYPVYQPLLLGNEKKYVIDCLDSNWISSRGSYIQKFEERFAIYTGRQYATTACNGTAAVYLALKALGIGEGDEVIVPTLVYVAVPNMVLACGGRPVFVDSLQETLQMDPEQIEKKLTMRTRAVIAVHNYGHPCDMETIRSICDRHGLFLIEDNAEALGSKIQGKPVGSWGDLSVYSFFGNKTLTTGEGGMVTSDDESLIQKVNLLKNQGVTQTYWHEILGYNFRMTNLQAAIGLAQLEKVDDILVRKREIAMLYASLFEGSPYECQGAAPGITHSYWMCSILVSEREKREPMRAFLASEGIETRPFFYPAHSLPVYADYNDESYPVAEDLAARGMNLPSYPALTDDDVRYIAAKVLTFAAH